MNIWKTLAGGPGNIPGPEELSACASGSGTGSVLLRFYIVWFVPAYIFLSGFVFAEPAPAEFLSILALPALFVLAGGMRALLIGVSALYLLPRLISTAAALVGGYTPAWRFLAIDVYLLIVFFLTFTALRASADREKAVTRIMYAWVLAALVNALAGALAFGLGAEELFGVRMVRIGIRLEAFFKDPNVFGSFLIPPLIFLFSRITGRERGWKFVLDLAAFLLLGLTLIMTFSRASWLGASLALVILSAVQLITGERTRRLRTLVIIVGGALLLVIFLFVDIPVMSDKFSLREYFFSRIGFAGYDSKRFGAWAEALQLSAASPVFGISPGGFEGRYTMSVHNSYFRFLVEQGWFGVLSHLLLLIWLLVPVFRKIREYPLFAAGIAGLALSAVFIDAFHWRHLIVFVAMASAVSVPVVTIPAAGTTVTGTTAVTKPEKQPAAEAES